MLQYLLNTTAIWLTSLIIFDVFLRRESYHSYNRFYLLFTFLLGILLPLIHLPDGAGMQAIATARPMQQIVAMKKSVVTVAAPVTALTWQLALVITWVLGAAVAFGLLLVDVAKMVGLYRSGLRSSLDNWTMIETGKEHAPFSIANFLFVCSRTQYSDEEWDMLVVHEQRHTFLRHIIDLAIMQLAQVVFWFHPLIYVYNKRLLLVHEYQADLPAQHPAEYGRFLIEQALLKPAPASSHSFNRSPIKNRIFMLTHHSSTAARIKMLLFIPLALVCIFFFSKNSFAQKFEQKGNIVTYRGNRFELSKAIYDTIIVVDPIDGHQIMKVISRDPLPVKMNGARICFSDDTIPRQLAANEPLEAHVFKGLATELGKLPDGTYYIDLYNVVIDKKGKVIFYQYGSLHNQAQGGFLPPEVKEAVDEKIDALINSAAPFQPAMAGDQPVIAITNIFLRDKKINVNAHVVTISR